MGIRYFPICLALCVSLALAQATGFIQGKAVDSSGAPIYGALVFVEGENGSRYKTVTDDAGVFRISSLAPGSYSVRISATAFSDWTASSVPASATPLLEPVLAVLQVATQVTAVTVGLPPDEVAAEQISHELKQRPLAVIPNFYVSYESQPAPLSPKRKFHLALRLLVDPTTIAAAGTAAGIQQAKNSYWEWGQGSAGYAKRFAAEYGTAAHNLVITSVLAASVLHQDPRYFYSGRGTVARRLWYAFEAAFRTKSDSGTWQPPYAGLIGTVISAEISNTYYPGARTQYSLLGRSLTFHFLGLVAVNEAQEFLLKKLTSHKQQDLQSAGRTVLREGTPVRLIAVNGLSAEEAPGGQAATFILAEELTQDGKILARAGDIASGRVRQVIGAQVSGEGIRVMLDGVMLRAGMVDVPLRSSPASAAGLVQWRELPESGKIELTLFVARDVQFQEPR